MCMRAHVCVYVCAHVHLCVLVCVYVLCAYVYVSVGLQEADRQFRYIALELCAATLADFVAGKQMAGPIPDIITILHQALHGIAHLHSLEIGEGFSLFTFCLRFRKWYCMWPW